MLTRPYSSFLRIAFLTPIIVVTFLGCAGSQRKSELLMLQGELTQQNTRVYELEQENAELSNRLDRLGGPETLAFEPEAARALLESKLAGTGVTVQTSGLRVRLLLPSTVLFGAGKTTLNPKAKTTIKKIGSTIKTDFPNAIVRIEGHTDNTPIKKIKKKFSSNWELSIARAATVARFLVDKCSFDPAKIHIAGLGEFRPIANNKTKAGRRKNRRVEIVILSRDAG
jgi:chemotaxis protein MotB